MVMLLMMILSLKFVSFTDFACFTEVFCLHGCKNRIITSMTLIMQEGHARQSFHS